MDLLVINPTNTFFRFKLPGGTQSGAPPRKSFHWIPWTQIYIKFTFSGQHWTELSIEKCKKNQFLVCLTKISISILNFSNEIAKKSAIYDLLFVNYMLLKRTISIPLKWEINTTGLTFYNQIFLWFGAHFDDRPKIIFLLTNCENKIKSKNKKIKISQAQSIGFIFKEATACKKRVRTSAHPRYE